MNASAFLETINGFDILLMAIAIGIGYYASIQGDLADKWEGVARHYETQYSASEELVRDLNGQNNELFILCGDARYELLQVEDERDLMAKFIDKKCYCLKSHTEIRCPFHDFVEQERERQIDPWSAPPQTPRKATSADLERWQEITADMGFCSSCDAGVSPADSFVTIDDRLICQGCRWEQLV